MRYIFYFQMTTQFLKALKTNGKLREISKLDFDFRTMKMTANQNMVKMHHEIHSYWRFWRVFVHLFDCIQITLLVSAFLLEKTLKK